MAKIRGNGGNMSHPSVRLKRITVTLAVTALALGAASVVAAPTAASDIPAEASSAIKEWRETGELSAENRATLLKYPEIASQLVDPDRRDGTTSIEFSPTTDALAAVAASGCHEADRYINYYTLVGALAVRWHSVIRYCWSGGKVTQQSAPYAYLSHNNGLMVDRGFNRSTAGNKTATYTATITGQIQNCIWDGCLNTENPRARYKVYGSNGSYEYTPTP
jgi:uncharacterized protein YfaP (DUF2135 family)